MKLITVIGGTGMTGECVVDYALQKGLLVRLLYRSDSTLPLRFRDRVELIQGNALNLDDCKRAVDGVDGVCIVLGTRNNLDPTTELSTGTANLIAAMKECNVPCYAIVMSSFLFRPLEEVPTVFKYINTEHQRMLDMTKESGLNFVAILPPHISSDPPKKFEVVYDGPLGRVISKYDLAKFIVDSLEQKEHYGKVCGIGYPAPKTT